MARFQKEIVLHDGSNSYRRGTRGFLEQNLIRSNAHSNREHTIINNRESRKNDLSRLLPFDKVSHITLAYGPNDEDQRRASRPVGQWQNQRPGQNGPPEHIKSLKEAAVGMAINAIQAFVLPLLTKISMISIVPGAFLFGFTLGRAMRAGWHYPVHQELGREIGSQLFLGGLLMAALLFWGLTYPGIAYAAFRLLSAGAGVLSGFLTPTIFLDSRPPS